MKIKLHRHHSGDLVGRGTYLNTKTWELVGIAEGGEQLPGPCDSSYVRIPALTVLLAGPMIGLAFILLLPALAPVALAAALISRVKPHSRIANWIAMPAAASPRPGVAFLQPQPLGARGQGSDAPARAESAGDHELSQIDILISELEREIDQRRKEKKG